ncbi:MAG: AAA family ATPase, partial [Myxococcota bacterium]
MQKKLLPIGIQAFEDIRQNNFIYVDKTQAIWELACNPKGVYFLARPRRFGKSLLLSTLSALFQGKRELFKGLWIEQEGKWDWAQKHPVIHLDMTQVPRVTSQQLEQGLALCMKKIIRSHKLNVDLDQPAAGLLRDTVEELSNPLPPVLLIDEYDAPLVDHLRGSDAQEWNANLKIAEANRQILKDFYGILKAQGGNLRFLMVTGVSKVAHLSVFSGLSNLNDITLHNRYDTLLGYTQQELENNFAPYIEELARKEGSSKQDTLNKIRRWYDGYCFSRQGKYVYNPFSTLLLFDHQEFESHWYATGTPTLLTNTLKRYGDVQPTDLVNATLSESAFTSYKLQSIHESLLPLMVQTGYLTLKTYDRTTRTYTLDYPNQEVREAFTESLLQSYTHSAQGKTINDVLQLSRALEKNDLPEYFVALRRILAGISYELHIPLERYYQTVFYLIHQLLGYHVATEVRTNTGRIDAVIDLDQHTYVFEFKLEAGTAPIFESDVHKRSILQQLKDPVKQAQHAAELQSQHEPLAQKALQQIQDKQYHAKYLGKGKPVTLIGAVFTVNTLQGEPIRQVTA